MSGFPSLSPVFTAWLAHQPPETVAALEAAWAQILARPDIGGRNADYARRKFLLDEAEKLGFPR